VSEADLLDNLTGEDAGGTWTDASNNAVTFPITTAETYTYTVAGTGSCASESDTATVTINITNAPEAGTSSGAIEICSTDSVSEADLLDNLTGEDAGGTWTDASNNAVTFPITTAGTYTYTVTGTGSCASETDTATVTINITDAPEAGTSSGAIEICSTDGVFEVDLLDNLIGEDSGGSFTDSNGDIVFFPISQSGIYTYTVLGSGVCAGLEDSADITINVLQGPDAGTSSSVDLCSIDELSETELFNLLGANSDTGGVWTDASNNPVTFPVSDAGDYIYTVTGIGACAGEVSTATVTIFVQDAAVSGEDGTLEFCSNDTVSELDLFNALGGDPDEGGTWTDADDNVVVFPIDEEGTYFYTVTGNLACELQTDVSQVEVSQTTAPSAGTDGTIEVFSVIDLSETQLFNALLGNPDADGIWTDEFGNPVTFPIDEPGIYFYTVVGIDACSGVEATASVTVIQSLPELTFEKVASLDLGSDNVAGAGDIITYTYTLTNTGDSNVFDIEIIEDPNLFTGTGTLPNPIYVSGGQDLDGQNDDFDLAIGDVIIYTASYSITTDDINAGFVENQAFVFGDDAAGDNISEVSDDPNNPSSDIDPTTVTIDQSPSLEVTKTASVNDNGDGVIGVGDVINYTITVENNGNVTLTDLSLVDTISNSDGVELALDSGPTFVSSNLGSVEGTLLSSEIATYIASYTITQADVDSGGISNSVTATALDATDDIVSDVSDNGDDSDGNSTNDATTVILDSFFDLAVTKEANVEEAVIGDEIVFTISVANEGLVVSNAVVVEEILPSGYQYISDVTSIGSYSIITGEWLVGTLSPGQVETLVLTVSMLSTGDYLNVVNVFDENEPLDDNRENNTASASVEPICFNVYNEFSPNGDGVNEFFIIDCIENFPDNRLEVYNRWGNLVYKTNGYKNDWNGISNGRATLNEGEELPVGTYYYILDFGNGSEPRNGWLYINR
ncbi:MAG: gliding motility-associated C-terminal domain-containing protein, partial [Bacteroidota bacterium]